MPINPLSGRSPRSLGHCSLRVADIDIGRALRPHKSFFWPSSGARTGGSRVSRTRSEHGYTEGAREGCWFGSALERRDTAEFATIHFFHLLPRSTSAGRSVATQGSRRKPKDNDVLLPRFGFQRKEAPARVVAGWRAGNARAACCPISLLRPVVTRLYRRRRGRAGGTQSDSYFQNSSRRRARSI